MILWGTQRMMTKDHPRDFSRGKTIAITVGEPMHPTGDDPVGDTARLHAADVADARDTIAAYPADEQPPGSWWVPASMGGSAPTLEEAARLDGRGEAGARSQAGREAREEDKALDRQVALIDKSMCRFVDLLIVVAESLERGPALERVAAASSDGLA